MTLAEARTLELTPLARVELEAIAPAEGLIFGRYDYRRTHPPSALTLLSDLQTSVDRNACQSSLNVLSPE